jgi:tRNA modification GTPase
MYDYGVQAKEGIKTVIAGRPNAGKSTIMNLLTREKRSIVTSVAGTTRDVIEETVFIDGIRLRLSDTAGLRSTDDEVEKIGVERAEKKIEEADFLIAVFDSNSEEVTDEDRILRAVAMQKKSLCILNKSDLPQKFDASLLDGCENVIKLCANDRSSYGYLAQTLQKLLRTEKFEIDCCIAANSRQRNCIRNARLALGDAVAKVSGDFPLDIVSVLVDEAISQLLELTGEKVTDAVVDEIFSKFCVGK